MTQDSKDDQKYVAGDKQGKALAPDLEKEFPEGLDQEHGDGLLKTLLSTNPKPRKQKDS